LVRDPPYTNFCGGAGSTLYFRVFGTGREFLFDWPAVQATALLHDEGDYTGPPDTVTKHSKTAEDSLKEKFRRTELATSAASWRDGGLRVGIGDDAALFRPRVGYETILTCDWFLEGTHFLADRHPVDSVAWKCLARAVSDIAAMGGKPSCFLLSLALPGNRTGAWLEKFLAGLKKVSRTLRCPIAGGDTTQRKEILINVTVIGECPHGAAVLRNGASAGDALFVTGCLGGAEYGLRLVKASRGSLDSRDQRLQKHLYPLPRLAAGAWLRKHHYATSMIDLSDGLSTDLPRLCEASGVGARVQRETLPCVRIANIGDRKKFSPIELALHGGDEYELLFTVAPKNVMRIPKSIGRLPITRIGEITSQKRVVLLRERAPIEILKNKGWDPFR
jgi:thiamine-monophosphate kinase